MTADDSIKWRCMRLDITAGRKGGFQNPRVCLQVFPYLSFPPLPALLLLPLLMRSWSLVACSLLRIRTEPLAMQANVVVVFCL